LLQDDGSSGVVTYRTHVRAEQNQSIC